MSVDQTQVIDVVSQDKDGTIVLSISDHLDWDNGKQHLLILQEKINTYLNFIDSGEIYERYPDAKGHPIQIDVRFHYQPNMEARAFLAKVKPIVENSGYSFRFEQISATPFTI
jgi:uncharacterized protein DUF6572